MGMWHLDQDETPAAVIEMRRMLALARGRYAAHAAAVLREAAEFSKALEKAVGDVSPEEALIGLANFVTEAVNKRIG